MTPWRAAGWQVGPVPTLSSRPAQSSSLPLAGLFPHVPSLPPPNPPLSLSLESHTRTRCERVKSAPPPCVGDVVERMEDGRRLAGRKATPAAKAKVGPASRLVEVADPDSDQADSQADSEAPAPLRVIAGALPAPVANAVAPASDLPELELALLPPVFREGEAAAQVPSSRSPTPRPSPPPPSARAKLPPSRLRPSSWER